MNILAGHLLLENKRPQDSTTDNTKKKVKLESRAPIPHQTSGHRPVTSCTHCRQHKIKCNASENYPQACTRCQKMGLSCEINPQFRPKKGSQIQTLRNEVGELKIKLELLHRNETMLTKLLNDRNAVSGELESSPSSRSENTGLPPIVVKTFLKRDPVLLNVSKGSPLLPKLLNDSSVTNNVTEELPPYLKTSDPSLGGDVRLPLEKAEELHVRFIQDYLPFLPILTSNGPVELYSQSQLLFWTVCLTACLSNPDPTLYNKLAALIKQLAIETCWIRTPRSTHIVQSLLILSCWPLPHQKVLDDPSYRFVGLAKNLGYQLGLHRGKFMSEFSRTQASLVNAEKWRTRTWLAVFFSEQMYASMLGLPPSILPDYLVENARVDSELPKNFRCLICLAVFQSKLINIMGSSVTSPDGLMTAKNRAGSLNILIRELQRLTFKLQIDDPITEMYHLYVKLLVCAFAFLPETPGEDQTKYVTLAYYSATRIVTIFSKLVEVKQLCEYPVYVRHSVAFACFTLFKLHLTPLLLDKYVDSARQSIVTVHRLFRNMLASWKDVDSDISRTAKVLEKLNYVIVTEPSIFLEGDGIVRSNRSHLANSLFYDLVSCIHEARRRHIARQEGKVIEKKKMFNFYGEEETRKLVPLPFYNQITRDNFKTITATSPNGTTVTTLEPTQSAMSNAKASATAAGLPQPTEISGIPLLLLEATGSIGKEEVVQNSGNLPVNGVVDSQSNNAMFLRESNSPFPNATYNSTDNLFGDFLQQQISLEEANDDLLGWFDVNMAPEF